MNRKKNIESTPSLSALVAIARQIATSEDQIIGAYIRARRMYPDLAEQADIEVARLDAAVESTWNSDEQETADAA